MDMEVLTNLKKIEKGMIDRLTAVDQNLRDPIETMQLRQRILEDGLKELLRCFIEDMTKFQEGG